jgi:hypothetical protein
MEHLALSYTSIPLKYAKQAKKSRKGRLEH